MLENNFFQAMFSLLLEQCSLLQKSLSYSFLKLQFTYRIFIYSQSYQQQCLLISKTMSLLYWATETNYIKNGKLLNFPVLCLFFCTYLIHFIFILNICYSHKQDLWMKQFGLLSCLPSKEITFNYSKMFNNPEGCNCFFNNYSNEYHSNYIILYAFSEISQSQACFAKCIT